MPDAPGAQRWKAATSHARRMRRLTAARKSSTRSGTIVGPAVAARSGTTV